MGHEITSEDVETVEQIFDGAETVMVMGQGDEYGEAITVEYDGYMSASIGDFAAVLDEGYVVDNVGEGWFQLVPFEITVSLPHQDN